ncbi:HEXXH motif-containing putative peptide modification protein [Sphaerisporangium sp. B11E5]|uniref:aKG-HExxH-type peptide beta-hydroxylase n=1 Tax=Sphaerisporangium sp. B11E5 TaxID=3153563 RepID=UPI00325F4577
MTAYDLSDPLALLNGMPFLDDGFTAKRLMAAVAAARHVTAQREGMRTRNPGRPIESWLGPSAVLLLAGGPSMPAVPLTAEQKSKVTTALQELASLIPPWAPLTTLPIRYACLRPANGAISASSRAWPQHILLADDAFTTAIELREQITHELAHQWLYLIEELWRLERPSPSLFTLPSGTTGRSPSEVLGAVHVAAVLNRLYVSAGDAPDGRMTRLSGYRMECLALLDQIADELTDIGRSIARLLKEAV